MGDSASLPLHKRVPIKTSVAESSASRRKRLAVAVGKERRDSILRAKRFCVAPVDDSYTNIDGNDAWEVESGEEISNFNAQLYAAVKELKSSVSSQDKGVGQNRVVAIRKLRRLMSRSELNPVEVALNGGVVPLLVQCLSFGSPCEQLLEAAWCLTNIAAGKPEETRALLPALPLLIAHLGEQGSSPVAEQCAWAIGNVAGEGEDLRKILLCQGALQPLARMLFPNKGSAVRTAAWALSNLIKGPDPKAAAELIKVEGILDAIYWHLKKDDVELVTEVAWVVAYLTALSNSACSVLLKSDVFGLLIDRLSTSDCQHLLIPVLRSVGNIIACESEKSSTVLHHDITVDVLVKCLKNENRVLKKEATWALSNIAAGSIESKLLIYKSDALPFLLHLFATAQFDIKKEVAYVLGNLCVSLPEGNSKPDLNVDCLVSLVRRGCLPGFINLVNSVDIEAAKAGLQFLELVLRGMPNGEGVRLVEEAGGIDAMERFQFHENEELRNMANCLCDMYFGDNYGLDHL